MNEEIKNLIEELEGIVKALHRSAANLDDIIEEIKLVGLTESETYLKQYIEIEADMRKTTKKYAGYAELDELEDDIWEKLSTSISVETDES
jgi:hypothetical protein